MTKRLPKHIVHTFGSARRFRSHHRLALQRLRQAFEDVQRGSAYSPAYSEILVIKDFMRRALDKTRPAAWEGRRRHSPTKANEP